MYQYMISTAELLHWSIHQEMISDSNLNLFHSSHLKRLNSAPATAQVTPGATGTRWLVVISRQHHHHHHRTQHHLHLHRRAKRTWLHRSAQGSQHVQLTIRCVFSLRSLDRRSKTLRGHLGCFCSKHKLRLRIPSRRHPPGERRRCRRTGDDWCNLEEVWIPAVWRACACSLPVWVGAFACVRVY